MHSIILHTWTANVFLRLLWWVVPSGAIKAWPDVPAGTIVERPDVPVAIMDRPDGHRDPRDYPPGLVREDAQGAAWRLPGTQGPFKEDRQHSFSRKYRWKVNNDLSPADLRTYGAFGGTVSRFSSEKLHRKRHQNDHIWTFWWCSRDIFHENTVLTSDRACWMPH